MINQQDCGRYYASCTCGVCGPLRVTRHAAIRDDLEHAKVCTLRKAAA